MAIGRQSSSKTVAGLPATSCSSPLQMLAPQPQAGRAGDRLVVRDDVHLGVVQKRVGIEVRGADGQPAVVDDPHLGVDVDDVAQRPLAGVHGAGEEAVVALVRLDQRRHLPARDVRPVVRARREQDDDPEVVGRRDASACRRGCRRPRATRGTGSRGRRSAPPSAGRRGRTRGSSSRPCGAPCRSLPAPSASPAPSRRLPARAVSVRGAPHARRRVQRRRKCSATSRTAGPSIRTATSCQPMPPRAR